MANIVGKINTCHEGATYSVADIYDEAPESVSKELVQNCLVATYFDPINGIVDVGGEGRNSFIFYTGGATDTAFSHVTTEYAKFDYALKLDKGEFFYINLKTSGGGNSFIDPIYALEGWFYVDTTADSDTGAFFSYRSGTSPAGLKYIYTKTEGVVKAKLQHGNTATATINLPDGAFDDVFHVGLFQDKNGGHHIVFNGQQVGYPSESQTNLYTAGKAKNTFRVGCWTTSSAAQTSPYFNGYVSQFRLTYSTYPYDNVSTSNFTGKYTVNFTPASLTKINNTASVEGNMVVRHNNANCYVPLTSTKMNTTTPCLATYHNGKTYYAIK